MNGKLMALVCLLYPHTWVNMSGPNDEELVAFQHQGVFYARIFSRKTSTSYIDANKNSDDFWVALHVTQGNYQTIGDV